MTRMLDIVYLSLGSNIGDREEHLRDAIARSQKGRSCSRHCFFL